MANEAWRDLEQGSGKELQGAGAQGVAAGHRRDTDTLRAPSAAAWPQHWAIDPAALHTSTMPH